MLRRVAHRLGYVPREELTTARDKLQEVRRKLEKTAEALTRATAAAEQVQQLKEQLKEERDNGEQRYDALLARFEKVQQQRVTQTSRLATLEHELHERQATVTAVEARVTSASADVEDARDVLMAVEVKLDILEGAANVLDRRLRALHPARGAAVVSSRTPSDTP